eukprot:Amastigsp_a511200_9.p3 type:complete len:207 gc:universal Amastigsp_a511200_9:791-1411(+)
MLVLVGLHVFCRQGQQLLDHRLLAHGVDELGVAQVHRLDLAFAVRVEQHLDGADQLVQVRLVTELGHVRDHLGADAVQKTQALVADGHSLGIFTGSLQFLELDGHRAQHVGVQAAAQTLIGRHHDETRCFGVVGRHERVGVLGVGLGQVGRDVADLVAVRTGSTHPFLRLAHLGGRHHFHGFGDLLGVLHRLDLAAYFLACCHSGS